GQDDLCSSKAGEEILVPLQKFQEIFPAAEIAGERFFQCKLEGRHCDTCNGCISAVRLVFDEEGRWSAHWTVNNPWPTHKVGEFPWRWSGHGANEHWLDDSAQSLGSPEDYRSGSGLTADSSRIVAYKRHVEIRSFRGDCADTTTVRTARPGLVWAEFVNDTGGYRANWTGKAFGTNEQEQVVVGDDLDRIVETLLSGDELCQPTVCRHNAGVQAHVIVTDPARLPYHLCLACRQQGVRWQEFHGRNRADVCPYFRRACKGVVEKSDPLPAWFRWQGNLVASTRRLKDGDHEAYEVTFVRRRDGFVRRAVTLFNLRTREAWMYRYNGYIPRTLAEFQAKFVDGRQVMGFGATIWKNGCGLTQEMVSAAISAEPVWKEGKLAIFSTDFSFDYFSEVVPTTIAVAGAIFAGTEERKFVADSENLLKAKLSEDEELGNQPSAPNPFFATETVDYYLFGVGREIIIKKNMERRVVKINGGLYLVGVEK
ncbi:MAG: hypothetical protein PHT51_05455, partial [Patescibacteria group bacterium]|nr:hypothetical protein [Patescibacteria group bacterium]